MQLFIPFFSVANVFKLFPGDKSFTYRQVVENFCFLGGGGESWGLQWKQRGGQSSPTGNRI